MNRRIFGFQRRVWWPKWTPASRSSRMETTATCVFPFRFDGVAPVGPDGTCIGFTDAKHRRPGCPPGRGTKSGYMLAGAGSRERRLEIAWKRRLDVDPCRCHRVVERQACSVEELPPEAR